MPLVTLTCQNGNHSWERESQRGRKPNHCSDHLVERVIPIDIPETNVEMAVNPSESDGDETESLDAGPTLLPAVAAGKERIDRLMDLLENRTRFGRLTAAER